MSFPLAVLRLNPGLPSETFIRRHVRDLLPGGSVLIAYSAAISEGPSWCADCPTFCLEPFRNPRLRWQVVRAVGQRLGWSPANEVQLCKRFLQKHKVKVFLGEFLDDSLPWLPVAKELGIRFFAHAHGYDVSQRLRDPRWRTDYLRYNKADGVITMSQVSRERLIAIGMEPTKIHVIPYGVDVPARQSDRCETGSTRCVAVGRLVAKKAPILLLDAFRRAAEALPGIRLDYVGGGPLLAAAAQYVHAFQLGGRVTLHGAQPNEVVQQLMQDANIFLQHSMTDPDTGDEEGLPVAVLEAMAQGLPVVSTRHAGIPEAVLDGVTGFLVDEGDSGGMAERLAALARDRELRVRHGGCWLVAGATPSRGKEKGQTC